MTNPASQKEEGMSEIDTESGKVWVRLGGLLTVMGGGFAYVIANWSKVEPVLSSPAIVLVAMLSIYGLGGLSVYWLVARPLEKRQARLEEVISRMRARERELETQIGDLRVEVAEMRTILRMSGLVPVGELGKPPEDKQDPG